MPKLLSYNGYSADFDIDSKSNTLLGRVLDLSDSITFEGNTPKDLEESFQKSVDTYIEFCSKIKKKPEKPFSGNIAYRTDPDTHRKILLSASSAGVSINKWIDEILKKSIEGDISAMDE
jgi:predicted HicB family RNase H-like nuclease